MKTETRDGRNGRGRHVEAPDTGASAHRHRLLVVEDNADVRTAVAALLRLEGFQVITAVDGEQALARLRAGPAPCVILLDFSMPGWDGPTFRREQIRTRTFAAIPTVLFSAHDGLAQKAAELGIDEVLPKPVDFDALADVIARRCPHCDGNGTAR